MRMSLFFLGILFTTGDCFSTVCPLAALNSDQGSESSPSTWQEIILNSIKFNNLAPIPSYLVYADGTPVRPLTRWSTQQEIQSVGQNREVFENRDGGQPSEGLTLLNRYFPRPPGEKDYFSKSDEFRLIQHDGWTEFQLSPPSRDRGVAESLQANRITVKNNGNLTILASGRSRVSPRGEYPNPHPSIDVVVSLTPVPGQPGNWTGGLLFKSTTLEVTQYNPGTYQSAYSVNVKVKGHLLVDTIAEASSR